MTTESKPRTRRKRSQSEAIEANDEGVATEVPVEGEVIESTELAVVDHPTGFDPGTSAVAMLTDDEFSARLAMLKKGRERIATIQRELLVVDVDYGIIPGTDRHTLFKAGAEKLCQFYGLVSRIEVTPRIGDNVTAPAVRYDATCFIHHGSTDGPIVATGYGTANSWEKRYLRPSTPCPICGAPALMKSKFGPGMYCNPKAGGCGANVPTEDLPPSDPKGVVTTAHDLGNTLAKMAEKRSHVDATLRATATSGLFTQDVVEDENNDTQLDTSTTVTKGGAMVDADGVVTGSVVDSLSQGDDVTVTTLVHDVKAKELAAAGNASDPETGQIDADSIAQDPDPEFTPSAVQGVGRGGTTENANKPQIDEVSKLSREKHLGPYGLADEIASALGGPIDSTTLPEDKKAAASEVMALLNGMKASDIGLLLRHLRELPAKELPAS